MSQLKFAREN